jgi:glycosyltransferase involved in cell wall biosynthesis
VRVLIAFGSRLPPSAGGAPMARSGAELMAIRTGAALTGLGHQVTFLTDGPPAAAPCQEAAESQGLSAAGRVGPDLVHAFDLAQPALVRQAMGLAQRLGVPFVLTPSSAREVWPDVAFGDAACAAADLVFALTPAEAGDLAPASCHRIRLVGQGPSLAGRGDPAAFRRALPGEGPVVLFAGRRSLLKGLDVLALAAPLVWRAVPEAIFAVAGPPGDAAGRAAAVAGHRFVIIGEVDLRAKTDAIAGCTLLCLPSRADVFPLVFVEAWTLGRPVVSGDFRGAADVVRHGVDGLICAVRPEPVAHAVVSLLTDPGRCARLGAAGRERAGRDLTWEVVGEAVGSEYQNLAGAKGRAR